jgi:hypothetical protein
MNLFRTLSFITVLAVAAAIAPLSALAFYPAPGEPKAIELHGPALIHAQNQPTRPELKALEIRGLAIKNWCHNPTLPRETFRALCGDAGAQHQPSLAELKALELRGQGLNHLCDGGFVFSEAGYRAVCGMSRLVVTPLGAPDRRTVS